MDLTAEEFVKRLVCDETHDELLDERVPDYVDFHLPPWHDQTKFKTGQKFYRDNVGVIPMAEILGLVTILANPSGLKILVSSKKSSSSYTAYRRYLSTSQHVHSWFTHELRPGSKSWKSLLTVRQRHFKANMSASAKGIGRISQRDSALTQFGFMAHTLLYPHRLGIVAYDRDSWDGYNHAWATIIYMMGVKDEYNICMGTFRRSVEICRIIMQRVFEPLLEFPVEPYEHMAYVALEGARAINPLLIPKVYMYLTKMFAGVPGYIYWEEDLEDFRRKLQNGELPKTIAPALESWHTTHPRPDYNVEDYYRLADVPEYKLFSFFERVNLHYTMFLLWWNSTYIGKCFCNWLFLWNVWMVEHIPLLAYARGYANVWVNMFQEDIGDDTVPMSNEEVRNMLNRPPWYSKFYIFLRDKCKNIV